MENKVIVIEKYQLLLKFYISHSIKVIAIFLETITHLWSFQSWIKRDRLYKIQLFTDPVQNYGQF